MYHPTWSDNGVNISEFYVPLPDVPPKKEMVNYGLPIDEQFFQRTEIIDHRRAKVTEIEKWAELQFHKFHVGEWQLIRGKPIYINGWNYFFLNFWKNIKGNLPDFRLHDCEWFWFWDMCWRDRSCYGMIDIKPRRVGDTEKRLCSFYLFNMLYRRQVSGMQNKDDDTVQMDMQRLINAHQLMNPIIRPIAYAKGDHFVFDLPKDRNTRNNVMKDYENSIEGEGDDINTILSQIAFMPSTMNKFDGQEINLYAMGEFGKCTRYSTVDLWGVIRPCLELEAGDRIIGKAIFETTIEDLKKKSGGESVESLANAKDLWDDSDHNDKGQDGRTKTGMYRIFRDAITCGPHDEWGYPKYEENKAKIEGRLKQLQGDLRKQITYRRKYPTKISDCWLLEEGSTFDVGVTNNRLNQIQLKLDYKNRPREQGYKYPIPRKGFFIERDGIIEWCDTDIVAHQKFMIIDFPKEANKVQIKAGQKYPVNRPFYTMGVDPIDHIGAEGRNSKGAAAVFKKQNDIEELEGRTPVDEDGNYVAGEMKSNLWVCIYLFRPNDPEEFYEDMLKCARFYSVPILYETNKPGIRTHFVNRGYSGFLMYPGRQVATKTKDTGVPATESIIKQYIELLVAYAAKNTDAIHFPEILEQMLTFTGDKKSRTKHDIIVACGISLLADLSRTKQVETTTESNPWFDTFKI